MLPGVGVVQLVIYGITSFLMSRIAQPYDSHNSRVINSYFHCIIVNCVFHIDCLVKYFFYTKLSGRKLQVWFIACGLTRWRHCWHLGGTE